MLYLQIGLGYSAIDAAIATLPFSLGALVGSGVAVPLGPLLGKWLIMLGAIAQVTGFFWMTAIVRETGDSLTGPDLIMPMALAGLGLTLEIVPLLDLTLANTATTNAGAASGVFGMIQQVGSALGVAVVGVVFFGIVGVNFSPAVLRDAFLGGIWVPIIALTLSFIAAFFLPSVAALKRHKAEAEAAEIESESAVSEV